MKTRVMKKLKLLCLSAVTTLLISMPLMAQEDALKGLPGYVDFGELSDIFGEPTVQISVGASLLNLVGSLSAQEDPEVSKLFKKLNGVRVNVFETDTTVVGAADMVKSLSSTLSGSGWESVVTVNDGDEQVRIFMKIGAERIEGITVMAVDPTEAVFVNVIGDLDPEELGKVMDNFDIDLDGDDEPGDESDAG